MIYVRVNRLILILNFGCCSSPWSSPSKPRGTPACLNQGRKRERELVLQTGDAEGKLPSNLQQRAHRPPALFLCLQPSLPSLDDSHNLTAPSAFGPVPSLLSLPRAQPACPGPCFLEELGSLLRSGLILLHLCLLCLLPSPGSGELQAASSVLKI